MKHRFLITGLATATILSAVAVNQLSPSVYAKEDTTTTQSAGSTAKKLLLQLLKRQK